MAKRKTTLCKIQTQYDALVDEKLTIEENLRFLFDQIHAYLNRVKETDSTSQKDFTILLKFELRILKKLIEFNDDLSKLIDETPINRAQDQTLDIKDAVRDNNEGCEELKPSEDVKPEIIATDSTITHCPIMFPAQQSEARVESAEVGQSFTEIDQLSTPFQFPKEIPDSTEIKSENPANDIETLKSCLKSFSVNMGLNEESFSNMEDYFEKPSTSCMREHHNNPASATSMVTPASLEGSEISVKDTVTSSDSIHSISKNIFKQSLGNVLHNNDNVDTEPEVSIKSESNNKAGTFVKNCNQTALGKLNNYLVKKPPINDATTESLQSPDISLKPTTKAENLCNLKNIASKGNSHLKENRCKERNVEVKTWTRRKGNRERQDALHELKPRPHPKVGDECAFSHIESPSEFYIHINDDETALIDSLTEQLNEYFWETVSTHNNKQKAWNDIGKYCSSFIDDYNGWFRAEVLDWYMDNEYEDVLIQLVDYGNKRKLSYKKLRKMPKEMYVIPMLAIRCHFPLMYPFGSTKENKVNHWPEIAVETLISCSINNGKQNIFKVVYAQKDSHSLAVDLLNPLEENEENTLGQKLLDMELAIQIFNDSYL